jgi:hypothetical protein
MFSIAANTVVIGEDAFKFGSEQSTLQQLSVLDPPDLEKSQRISYDVV